MAEAVGAGYVSPSNVAAIRSFKDGPFMRFVHVEDGHALVFTDVENNVIHRCDCLPFGVIFIFDFTLELSSFDGRVVATVSCFSDTVPGGSRRHILPIKTDYFAQPEVRFGEG